MAGQPTRNPSYSSEIRVWYGLIKGNQDFINLDFPEIRGPISRNQKATEIGGDFGRCVTSFGKFDQIESHWIVQ